MEKGKLRREFGNFFSRSSRKLKAHEPLFLVISVSASTLSALAACIAAYLTLRQVTILEEERRTSFEVASYSERRTAIRDILRAAAEFENSAICYTGLSRSKKNGLPIAISDFRSCQDKVSGMAQNFILVARANLVSVPHEYRQKVFHYGDAANIFTLCEFNRPIVQLQSAPANVVADNRRFCTKTTDEGFAEIQALSIELTNDGIRMVEEAQAEKSRPKPTRNQPDPASR